MLFGLKSEGTGLCFWGEYIMFGPIAWHGKAFRLGSSGCHRAALCTSAPPSIPRLVQIRQMLWPFPSHETYWWCCARPRCPIANLSDVMKNGVLNASWRGKKWCLHVTDKQQLPFSE